MYFKPILAGSVGNHMASQINFNKDVSMDGI
jgi:hypothetical protein